MYRFHYDNIVKKYGERSKLLLTDTDSLCYHIRVDDVYLDACCALGALTNPSATKTARIPMPAKLAEARITADSGDRTHALLFRERKQAQSPAALAVAYGPNCDFHSTRPQFIVKQVWSESAGSLSGANRISVRASI